MHLSSLAVRRPVAVTVFVIIALIFGVISLQRIGIDLLPDMNFPYAVVVTIYPGGAAPVSYTHLPLFRGSSLPSRRLSTQEMVEAGRAFLEERGFPPLQITDVQVLQNRATLTRCV